MPVSLLPLSSPTINHGGNLLSCMITSGPPKHPPTLKPRTLNPLPSKVLLKGRLCCFPPENPARWPTDARLKQSLWVVVVRALWQTEAYFALKKDFTPPKTFPGFVLSWNQTWSSSRYKNRRTRQHRQSSRHPHRSISPRRKSLSGASEQRYRHPRSPRSRL